MSYYDYSKQHDMSHDEIVVGATLLYPFDDFRSASVDILQDGMRRFVPAGLKCCFARWANDLYSVIYFPANQNSPTSEQIVDAFYMEMVLDRYKETKEGNWLWD